jgi:uncharacterized membrane protein
MTVRGLLRADGPAVARVIACALVGVITGVIVGLASDWWYAPASGWTAAATIYILWTWAVLAHLDHGETAAHATREDPTRALTDILVVLSSLASLAGVAYVLVAGASSGAARDIAAAIGVASVVSGWIVVHTIFMLRYARLYYAGDHDIDFGEKTPFPNYHDFAYLAFTIGMTYQVSDTAFKSRTLRSTALRHALISYLLGAVILASTINLVAGLGHF